MATTDNVSVTPPTFSGYSPAALISSTNTSAVTSDASFPGAPANVGGPGPAASDGTSHTLPAFSADVGGAIPLPHSNTVSSKTKDHWETCLEFARKHVQKEVDAWREEITHLLFFASLISAVVGSFALESYHNAKQGPADTTALLLRSLLTLQLNATNPQPGLMIDLDPQIPISAAAKRIYIYHFLSLILSLIVVMIGIMCYQWLREYRRDPWAQAARREHMEMYLARSEGLEKWQVFGMLKLLPVMLLLSLLLFLFGVVELLLEVNHEAAVMALVIILPACAFLVATTLLPALQGILAFSPWHIRLPQCPYKSLQAWLLCRFAFGSMRLLRYMVRKSFNRTWLSLFLYSPQNWPDYDWIMWTVCSLYERAGSRAASWIFWLGNRYFHNEQFAEALYRCLWDIVTTDRESLIHILTLNSPHRASCLDQSLALIPGSGGYRSNDAEAHLSNLLVFQTLEHLIERNWRSQPSPILLERRLELFIKICETRLVEDLDCPLLAKTYMKTVIPREMWQKVLRCILRIIQKFSAAPGLDHLKAVCDILELESEMPDPASELFRDAKREVEKLVTNLPPSDWRRRSRSQVLERIQELERSIESRQYFQLREED